MRLRRGTRRSYQTMTPDATMPRKAVPTATTFSALSHCTVGAPATPAVRSYDHRTAVRASPVGWWDEVRPTFNRRTREGISGRGRRRGSGRCLAGAVAQDGVDRAAGTHGDHQRDGDEGGRDGTAAVPRIPLRLRLRHVRGQVRAG